MLIDQPLSEREILARIESLELNVRDVRRKIEHSMSEADKRRLNTQLAELCAEMKSLSHRLRP